MLAHLRNYQHELGASEETVLMAGTPLSHLGGFISGIVFPAFLGARSVIMRSWQPDEAVPLIERERVSLMMGAPVFLADLVQRYEAGAGQAHRLSMFMCAGAAIHPSTIDRAQAVGVSAIRVYGMTETAGVCTMASADDPVERRSRWDGHLIPGMEIEAAGRDRRRLPPGEEGKLRIRGPQLLTGYTDPELTRAGGEKFSTMDIEAAIAAHPDVADVAVTAVPDERLGETVGAWIVLRRGATWAGPTPIIDHLEQRKLARQKIPA